MEAKKVTLPGFTVVGYQLETNLPEFSSGIGKDTYRKLQSMQAHIANTKNANVILMQFYPMKPDFNPQVDRFIQMLCFEVSQPQNIPDGMTVREVPEGKYVTVLHQGLESQMQRSYDFVYGQWMKDTQNTPSGFDFEIWDERYKPDSPENEIQIFVALQ